MTSNPSNISGAILEGNVSFKIYREDNTKIPTIKRAFIKEQTLSLKAIKEGKVVLKDGSEWILIFDSVYDLPPDSSKIRYICSYQVHTFGNYVVARLYNPVKSSQPMPTF